MARAPLARPTDAPPAAHDPSSDPDAGPSPTVPVGEAPLLPPDELPRHVAIIMDGNRRWARQRGLPELEGHAAGVEAIRELLRHAVRRGVPVLTLYAFSRENWARSDDEVTGLFGLLEAAIRSETDELRAQGVRIRLLGRLDELPDATRRSIGEALDATAGGDRLLLNIAFNYAGRTEIVDAVPAAASPAGSPADRDRRGGHQRRALHGRPARPRPRHPDRRRAAPLQLPDLAVGLRRVLLLRGAVARLRTRRLRRRPPRVRQPPPPLRSLTGPGPERDASASDQRGRPRPGPARRPRARRAGPRRGRRADHRGRRRSRSSGCSRAPATRRSRRSGRRLALVVVLDAAVPELLDGQRPPARRGRDRPGRDRVVHPARAARRPAGVDGHHLRRALRRAPVVRHPARERGARRSRPARRWRDRRGARLDPAADPRGLGVRHRARTSSARTSGGPSS